MQSLYIALGFVPCLDPGFEAHGHYQYPIQLLLRGFTIFVRKGVDCFLKKFANAALITFQAFDCLGGGF